MHVSVREWVVVQTWGTLLPLLCISLANQRCITVQSQRERTAKQRGPYPFLRSERAAAAPGKPTRQTRPSPAGCMLGLNMMRTRVGRACAARRRERRILHPPPNFPRPEAGRATCACPPGPVDSLDPCQGRAACPDVSCRASNRMPSMSCGAHVARPVSLAAFTPGQGRLLLLFLLAEAPSFAPCRPEPRTGLCPSLFFFNARCNTAMHVPRRARASPEHEWTCLDSLPLPTHVSLHGSRSRLC